MGDVVECEVLCSVKRAFRCVCLSLSHFLPSQSRGPWDGPSSTSRRARCQQEAAALPLSLARAPPENVHFHSLAPLAASPRAAIISPDRLLSKTRPGPNSLIEKRFVLPPPPSGAPWDFFPRHPLIDTFCPKEFRVIRYLTRETVAN